MISAFNNIQKTLIWKIVPVLIGVAFIFGMISSSTQGVHQSTANNLVTFTNASGEDTGITLNQFNQAYQEQYRKLLDQLGQEKFEKLLSEPNAEQTLKQTVLQNLIQEKALYLYADKIGIRVQDPQILARIREIPAFHDNKGKFSTQQFERILGYNHLTVPQYYSIVKRDLTLKEVSNYITNSVIIVPREVDIATQLSLPSAQIQVATVQAKDYINDISVTQEQLQEYYLKHKADYLIPAEASLSYIIYTDDELLKNVPKPTEAEIKNYYDKNPEIYSPDVYKVSDIIVSSLDTANDIVSQLDNGANFADLAKKYSEDFGSKDNGGSLGDITLNDLPPILSKVVQNMVVGKNSRPIKYDDQYHILFLSAKDHRTISFDQAKSGISDKLSKFKQNNYLAEIQAKIKEVNATGGSIADIAKILNLPVVKTEPFTMAKPPAPLTPEAVKLAFDGESLQQGIASGPQPFKTADGKDEIIIMQLNSFKDLSYKPLDQVKDNVTLNEKLLIAQNRQTERLKLLANKLNATGVTDEQAAKLLKQAQVKLSDLRTLPFYQPGEDNLPYYQTLFTSPYNGHKIDYIAVPVESTHVVYLIAVHGFNIDTVSQDITKVFKDKFPEQVQSDFFGNVFKQIYQALGVEIDYAKLGVGDN